ncbi:MAG TPA: hypothetical protein VMF57_21855 [Solirubrobacteraceae bacterium]|nr:hypothetical protein [Solirubrobacteraceae bacterium]
MSKIIGTFPVPVADRITLEFDSGQPIRGRLLDQSGAAHAFYGWLELSALVEHAWRRGADPAIDAAGDLSGDDPIGSARGRSQVASGGDG